MRICELKEKEVINACDCCKLGYVEGVSAVSQMWRSTYVQEKSRRS